jgi:hypothetical protein
VSEIGNIPHLEDLLNGMRTHTISGPCSSQLHHLLTQINSADPDSGAFDEDDTNAQWGHYQFRHGLDGFSFQGITWSHTGNIDKACHILAATIKSCKVAHYLCHRNKIQSSSYLADIYLQEIVGRLWKGMKELLSNGEDFGDLSMFYF